LLVIDPLLGNSRSLGMKIAMALGGRAIEQSGLIGFLNSNYGPYVEDQLEPARPRGLVRRRRRVVRWRGRPVLAQ
jgi:hypothetical protein